MVAGFDGGAITSDAGARWKDKRIDLVDIVVANGTVEMGDKEPWKSLRPDAPAK